MIAFRGGVAATADACGQLRETLSEIPCLTALESAPNSCEPFGVDLVASIAQDGSNES